MSATLQGTIDLSSASACRGRTRWLPRRGVTAIELLTVVAILLFLVAMLVPGLQHAKEQARRVQCINNMKQWGVANQCYRDENFDYFPTEGNTNSPQKKYTWYNELPPYLSAPSYGEVERSGGRIKDFPALHVWICPSKDLSRRYKSDSGMNQFHYAMNQVLDGMDSAETPDFRERTENADDPILASQFKEQWRTVFLFEIFGNSPCGKQDNVGTSFHRGIGNVLFLDGSVDGFSASDFVKGGDFVSGDLIWQHPRLYWGYLPPAQRSARE